MLRVEGVQRCREAHKSFSSDVIQHQSCQMHGVSRGCLSRMLSWCLYSHLTRQFSYFYACHGSGSQDFPKWARKNSFPLTSVAHRINFRKSQFPAAQPCQMLILNVLLKKKKTLQLYPGIKKKSFIIHGYIKRELNEVIGCFKSLSWILQYWH